MKDHSEANPRNSVLIRKNSNSLKIDERREKIMGFLEKDGQVYVTQLAEIFGTTPVTIRSDLLSMEQQGLIERIPGGAVSTTLNLYNREFMRRKSMNANEKRILATAVVAHIQEGDTLFMNGGSTTYYAALILKRMRRGLIVVTNSITIATELGTTPTFSVILLGGQINPIYSFTCGSEALDQLNKYRVNKAILSVDGVDENGISTIHPEESTIAAAMIQNSAESIIIADGSKIGKTGFCNICSLSRINTLITNNTADPGQLEMLKEHCKQLITV